MSILFNVDSSKIFNLENIDSGKINKTDQRPRKQTSDQVETKTLASSRRWDLDEVKQINDY